MTDYSWPDVYFQMFSIHGSRLLTASVTANVTIQLHHINSRQSNIGHRGTQIGRQGSWPKTTRRELTPGLTSLATGKGGVQFNKIQGKGRKGKLSSTFFLPKIFLSDSSVNSAHSDVIWYSIFLCSI